MQEGWHHEHPLLEEQLCCSRGNKLCRDWEEMLKSNLANTIYVNMPDYVRSGKPARPASGRAKLRADPKAKVLTDG